MSLRPDLTLRDSLLAPYDDDELVRLTADLIAIESHRLAPSKETHCAEFLCDLFRREGIDAGLQEVTPGRCNVWARLPGKGGGKSLMFNGHIDTVPPGEMVDPFAPRIANGRMHGRGTCDMKGGVACQVYALLCLKRAGVQLDGDVLFTGVIAEEDGTSLGAVHVAAHGPRADMVLVAEPTALETVIAHKGFDYYAVEVRGRAAHSSRPENGVSAIYKAAKVVRAIEECLLPEIRKRQHPLLGPASINVSGIVGAARTEENLIRGRSDIQKYPGGTVPDFCTVYMDRRRIPGESLDEVFKEMCAAVDALAAEDPEFDAELRFLPACNVLDSHPPLDTAADEPLVRACLACNEAVAGVAPQVKGVAFWSDAAVFSDRLGVPAVVYGPGFVDVAHSVREDVPVDHLEKASRVMGLVAATVARAG